MLLSNFKTSVALNFNKPNNYDFHANIQKKAADFLIKLITKQKVKFNSILEIGCGTGILSQKIIENLKFQNYYLNDISKSMLNNCQKKLANNSINKLNFIYADGENYKLQADLLISNFSMQWFNDLNLWLKNNYNNFNKIAISMPTIESFKNWHSLLAKQGYQANIIELPRQQKIEKLLLKLPRIKNYQITVKNFEELFNNPIDFIKGLKKIGATSNKIKKSNVAALKSISNIKNNFIADYQVIFLLIDVQ